MSDIVIIGGGLAGWRAAEAAVARGCSVTLVANGVGNSPDVHALNCPVREEDSVERYFEDTMSSGRGANDPDLVRVMCERSLELRDEYAFGPDVIQPVGSTVPRCVSIDHAIGAIALRRIKDRLRDKVQVIDGTVVQVWSGRPRPGTDCSPRYFPGTDGYALKFAGISKGAFLPKWELDGVVYHLCFRLRDSVPQEKLQQWLSSRREISDRAFSERRELTEADKDMLRMLYESNINHYLDSGYGECLLARRDVLEIVLETLRHDNGSRYQLHAIGIQPNHVHLLLRLEPNTKLAVVLQTIKSVSSHRCNRILGRNGEVWQSDYYNHIIRTEEEYRSQMNYVACKNSGVFGWRCDECSEIADCFSLEVVRRQGEGALTTTGGAVTGQGAVDNLRCGQGALALTARSLIIATGGWCGKYDFTTNPRYLKGDGIRFAEALGGAVRDVDEEHVQYEPTVRIDGPRRGVPVITTLLHEGATLRNALGEEFLADKCANKDVIAKAIFGEIAAGRGEKAAGQGEGALTTKKYGEAMWSGRPRPDVFGVWYDLSGCTEDSLVRCRMDPKERRILVAPAAHSSLGGVVVDARCRVCQGEGALTTTGCLAARQGEGALTTTKYGEAMWSGRPRPDVVPGLFACGEVTAGVHGLNRLGGNGGTAAMVFGRIAGENAADYVKSLLKTDAN